MIPARPAGWLALTAAQPFLMEGAYQVAAWWWPDPLLVRIVTLAGPFALIWMLSVSMRPLSEHEIERKIVLRSRYQTLEVARLRAEQFAARWYERWTGLLLFSTLMFWLPWGVVGIEQNWSYRSADLGLQIALVLAWAIARWGEPATWHVEVASKRVGLAMAACGVVLFYASQIGVGTLACFDLRCFVVPIMGPGPDSPFLGTLPAYDPRTDTASAVNAATGFPWAVFVLPAFSIALTLGVAQWQVRRCHKRRDRRRAGRQIVASRDVDSW